jgi:hypothetical protein
MLLRRVLQKWNKNTADSDSKKRNEQKFVLKTKKGKIDGNQIWGKCYDRYFCEKMVFFCGIKCYDPFLSLNGNISSRLSQFFIQKFSTKMITK